MSEKRSRFLQILSANTQKSIANTDRLLELAVRHKIPLVCVQEPAVIRGKVRRHPGFTVISSDDPECRSAIYIDKKFPFSTLHDPLHFAVSISFSNLQIVCIYIHPRDELAFPAWRFLRSIRASQSHIIVGDFDTNHPLWDPHSQTNPRGELLTTWIAAAGLVILNPSGETQGSPWSPILFVLFTLPLARPSQGAAFAYMDDYALHTWSRDPFQLVFTPPSVLLSCARRRGASALGSTLERRTLCTFHRVAKGRRSREWTHLGSAYLAGVRMLSHLTPSSG